MADDQAFTYNPAKVVVNNQQIYQKVNAFFYDGNAIMREQDGTEVAVLQGPITITFASAQSGTWSNGTDTWYIQTDGCGCHGGV